MAEISKIKLPSGNVYDIKDETARNLIAGGITYSVAWDGNSVPTVANIPAGVVVTYNGTNYTGTKAASSAEPGTFYLVKTRTGNNAYDEYVVANNTWEKLGSKDVDLSGLGELAYHDTVSLVKGNGDNVLGSDATFTTTVTPTTTNIKATASGAAVGSNTDTFVKSYPGATSKLATTSVPNVTNVGSASTWGFAMGTGNDSETLIISGANGTAPTLGTAITAATGSLAANGGGDTVMTGLGTASTGTAVTSVSVSAQPTIALSTGATAGNGVISVATGITSASTVASNKDEVKVAKYADLGVEVSDN